MYTIFFNDLFQTYCETSSGVDVYLGAQSQALAAFPPSSHPSQSDTSSW